MEKIEYFETRNIWTATVGLPTLGKAWQRSGCTEAQIQRRYEDIPNWSDAGVFNVRISLVWRQFPLEHDEVTCRRLGVACLVNFRDSLIGGRERCGKMKPKTARNHPKNNTGLGWHHFFFDLSLKYLLSNFIAEQITTTRNVFILLPIDNKNSDRKWSAWER